MSRHVCYGRVGIWDNGVCCVVLASPVMLAMVLICGPRDRVKKTLRYREFERSRYGRLAIVHATKETRGVKPVDVSDTDPGEQALAQSGTRQLFNELPLEIFLLIFSDFSCKELGYVSIYRYCC